MSLEMPLKVWLPKFLRCIFLWRHERVSFYSAFYECEVYMCQICGWKLSKPKPPAKLKEE